MNQAGLADGARAGGVDVVIGHLLSGSAFPTSIVPHSSLGVNPLLWIRRVWIAGQTFPKAWADGSSRCAAREYGDRLVFLAGIDVQHVLQEADAEGVRQEVRYLIDTFDRPDGGLCLAAGNGIVAGTPFENIEAFLDQALRYGAAHRKRYNQS